MTRSAVSNLTCDEGEVVFKTIVQGLCFSYCDVLLTSPLWGCGVGYRGAKAAVTGGMRSTWMIGLLTTQHVRLRDVHANVHSMRMSPRWGRWTLTMAAVRWMRLTQY